jgi:hypothetical protein
VVERGTHSDREVEDGARLRRIERPRRIEAASVVGHRLLVGIGVLVASRRLECQLHRHPRRADRDTQAGVAGPLGQQAFVVGARGQRIRRSSVQLQPPAQRERPIARRAEQCVDEAEPSASGGLGNDETGGLGGLEALEHGQQRSGCRGSRRG